MEPIRKIRRFNFDNSFVDDGTRRLRVIWSPELVQDLQAYHGIDAEAELAALFSEQVAAEIDRGIVNRMWDNLQPRLDTFFPEQEVVYGPPPQHFNPMGQPMGRLFYLDFVYDSNPRINTPVTYDNEAWSLNGYFRSPIGIEMDIKTHKLNPPKRRSRRVVS